MPQEITIQGQVFSIDTPYAEGHPLKANEASALNGLLAENVRNNQANLVREAKAKQVGKEAKELTTADIATIELPENVVAELQGQIAQYVANYEFGVRSGGGRSKDPLEREIENMAEDILVGALKKNNITPSKFKKDQREKYDAALAGIIDQNRADLTKEAKRRLKNQQDMASASLAGILGGDEGTSESGGEDESSTGASE